MQHPTLETTLYRIAYYKSFAPISARARPPAIAKMLPEAAPMTTDTVHPTTATKPLNFFKKLHRSSISSAVNSTDISPMVTVNELLSFDNLCTRK